MQPKEQNRVPAFRERAIEGRAVTRQLIRRPVSEEPGALHFSAAGWPGVFNFVSFLPSSYYKSCDSVLSAFHFELCLDGIKLELWEEIDDLEMLRLFSKFNTFFCILFFKLIFLYFLFYKCSIKTH